MDGISKDFKETYRKSLLFIVLFELVSLCAFLIPQISTFAFFVIVITTAVLAFKRFESALLVLLAELFIGSQGGYMVALGLESGLALSLRIGLFLAVFGGWAAKTAAGLVTKEKRKDALAPFALMERKRLLKPYVLLLAVLAFGVIRGVVAGNGFGNVFFDANAYAFYALLPAFVAGLAKPETRSRALAVLLAAVTDSVGKALAVLFFFSHRVFVVASNVYVWIRDTRVGEITIMEADFYRIFFQSQIFALALIVAAALYAAYRPSWKDGRAKVAAAAVDWAMVSMVLSLSRSFWFGGACAALVFTALLVWGRAKAVVWRRTVGLALASVVFSVAVIGVLYSFPYPRKSGELSLTGLLGSRAMSLGDDAATSRWALLPLLNEAAMRHPAFGNGLGTTVTYTTSDPRLLATNPTGAYTTFAFEWGYHDLWVKFGALGLVVYAWFIASVLRPAVAAVKLNRAAFREPGEWDRAKEGAVLAAGACLAVVALLATNVFSPYLNHPLGIGLLMLVSAAGLHGAFEGENVR